MDYFKFFRDKVDIEDIYQTRKYKNEFAKAHPTYFYPDGILVFCGPQGSGKTLSAVNYVRKLCNTYPHVKLISNMYLNMDYFNNVEYHQYESLEDLNKYNNGFEGVIFLLDEIQIEFNSLESRNIDPVVMTEIAQQRKQRKHIVGTSQVFNRIAKPFREQFKYAVMCNNILGGYIQFNKIVRGEDAIVDENGKVSTEHVKYALFTHSPDKYKAYDTYAKIIRLNEKDFNGK